MPHTAGSAHGRGRAPRSPADCDRLKREDVGMMQTAGAAQFPAPVDGVEIKFSFSGAEAVAAVKESFGLGTTAAQRLSIYFFDALVDDAVPPRLRLLDDGVVLRLRHLVGDPDNSTVKLRPAVADRLAGAWRPGTDHAGDYRVEYDWGTQPVLAASLEDRVDGDDIKKIVAHPRRLATAFSHEQKAFLEACRPGMADVFDGLYVAGPIAALRWREIAVEESAHVGTLRAEQWDCDGRLSFIEVSTRISHPDQAPDRRARLVELLKSRDLTPDEGSTKTETVLRFLLARGAPELSGQRSAP
jgi:hypothetical protein